MLKALLKRVDASFGQASKDLILFLALAAAVIVGVLDHFSAPDLLILYLIPIFLASWYGEWRAGVAVSVYSAGAAFIAQTFFTGQYEGIDASALSTLLVRLMAFLLISHTIARLRESIRQQQELTHFIVHDLRSPISSAITGLMTLEQSTERLEEMEREMVQLALVSNQRALGLVNSMLDVAKLENGKMPVNKEHVDLDTFVEACFEQVALWARGNNVTLEKKIRVDHAVFDPALTGRVLVNLLSNALKFSPEGGRVLVRVTSGHHGVRFAVKDQGPGIPPEFVHTIFEPFTQVQGTQGGTGLGLTFCRLAIQAQGGRIWAESHLGEGTEMIFNLPLQHHRAELAAPQTAPEGP